MPLVYAFGGGDSTRPEVLGEAERRGRITQNPAKLAKAPRLADHEIEPYSIEDVQALLRAAESERNSARWAIALALGLRQGEVLGLQRSDVDLRTGTLWVRRGRLRPRYEHGCGGSCGKSPGYCPTRRQVRGRDRRDEVPCRASGSGPTVRVGRAAQAAPG
ncbi:hypothetical protein GCM10009610_48810 [Pseudonocardia xinjiangensis]